MRKDRKNVAFCVCLHIVSSSKAKPFLDPNGAACDCESCSDEGA